MVMGRDKALSAALWCGLNSRLVFNALQKQPRALRHAPLPKMQKSQQGIFAMLYFVRSFFDYLFLQRFTLRSFLTIYFCNGLFCAVFLTIYFDFDYIFLYI